MKQNETKIVPNSSNNYICNCCHYKTSRLSQYERHLLTDKHSNHINETNMKHFSSEKFQCICGILFKSRTTLWRHKNVCNQEEKICICNVHAEDFRKIYDRNNYKQGDKYISWFNDNKYSHPTKKLYHF